MAIKIKTTSGLNKKGIKVLVFGKSGIGKTTLMGTAPKPIILSCEGGLLTLAKKEIHYIEIETVQDIYDAYHFLRKSKQRKRYETICLDSITEMAERCLEEYKKINKDPRKAYGELADEMNKLIRLFRDLKNYNVVFSAKRARMVDDDTGTTQYIPGMPGHNLPQGLPYFFDEVFYLDNHESKPRKRILRTQPGLEHDAKDRSRSLKSVEKPDLTYIFNKIKNAAVDEKVDKKTKVRKT